MSLDTLYGEVLDPVPNSRGVDVYQWERTHEPISLFKLNSTSAPHLRELMMQLGRDFACVDVLSRDVLLIWVVDQAGEVWIAIEELFYEDTAVGLPHFRTFEPTADWPKLGHPSLIAASAGRIGGEILMTRNASLSTWTINKRSGRYGRHPSRTFRHLKNVANVFRSYGIELNVDPS